MKVCCRFRIGKRWEDAIDGVLGESEKGAREHFRVPKRVDVTGKDAAIAIEDLKKFMSRLNPQQERIPDALPMEGVPDGGWAFADLGDVQEMEVGGVPYSAWAQIRGFDNEEDGGSARMSRMWPSARAVH